MSSIGSAQSKQPWKISGRHAFLKEAMDTAGDLKGGPLSQPSKRKIFQSHGVEYRAKSPVSKRRYEAIAANMASENTGSSHRNDRRFEQRVGSP